MTPPDMPHAGGAPRHFGFPVLVADIGGTNARFALVRDAHGPTEAITRVATDAHRGFAEAAQTSLLDHSALLPRTAVIAAAGPVSGERIALTNAHWVIEPRDLIERLDLEQVIVLNDFEAQALALPGLEGDSIEQIGPGTADPHGAKVVLGPGTGLGVAAMVYAHGTWIPVPSEGGHVELGPVSEADYRIWPHIERIENRVTAERLLSGAGLLRLSRAVAGEAGLERRFETPADVTAAADAGDEIGLRTMEVFVRALGRVAGDFALTFLARGGVFLGGGIPGRIRTYLAHPAFREAFEAKAPHASLVREIPTYLIRHEMPALEGLAAFARTPTLFAVETGERCWSAHPPAPAS